MKVTGKMKNVHKCVIKNLHQGVITQCHIVYMLLICLFLLAEIPTQKGFLNDINFVSEWY